MIDGKLEKSDLEFPTQFPEETWDFSHIEMWHSLSEDLIREFADKWNWETISKTQNMSEEFMLEFEDRIVWKWVYFYHPQNLSQSLIDKYNLHVKGY